MQPNDINLVDTSGQSALHLACQRDSVELVNSLLSQSRYSATLHLHYAVVDRQMYDADFFPKDVKEYLKGFCS